MHLYLRLCLTLRSSFINFVIIEIVFWLFIVIVRIDGIVIELVHPVLHVDVVRDEHICANLDFVTLPLNEVIWLLLFVKAIILIVFLQASE